jgi:iron(III) transport system substrate-binding protein
MRRLSPIIVLALALPLACSCAPKQPTVVVYTSVDQVYAEPVLKAFAERTGIRVQPVFDVEATKTTGLANRLIAEKNHPRADVWWSGEFAQTMRLKAEGVLAPYDSPAAADIPAAYRDPGFYWTGVAGRARVLLVNTELLTPEQYPRSLQDLLDERLPGAQIGIAYPLFGTTATHAAALYAAWGREAARDYFARLQARGVRVVDGNSVVRDMVAQGQLACGLTDTDDACGAVEKGAPVEILFPDQQEGGLGTLVIPGTVALVADAPHPEQGRALIDYLVSAEVERELVASGWCQVPLRSTVAPPACPPGPAPRGMAVGLEAIWQQTEAASADLREIFVR